MSPPIMHVVESPPLARITSISMPSQSNLVAIICVTKFSKTDGKRLHYLSLVS